MTIYSPKFNVKSFELRGESSNFLTYDQTNSVIDTTTRVPSQLDWVAQLLGWSGRSYWTSLVSSVDQRRQLLGGSFGIYNAYLFPEIVEVRNWDESVIVKYNPHIQDRQKFVLGDYEYESQTVEKKGENLIIYFSDLPEQFYSDIADNKQLKFTALSALPAPFYRPNVGISGDASFLCDISEGSITLYPSFDTEKTLPYELNTLFAGSRYHFDLPLRLYLTDEDFISPVYDFESSNWYIDVPCLNTDNNLGLSGKLEYKDSFLIISIKKWENPSDWVNSDNLNNFKGVWSNKGGPLPYHFVFDSLSLHGVNPEKSLLLEPVKRSLNFDNLLEQVYIQRAEVSQTPPPVKSASQVWWDSLDRRFYVYLNDPLNCGPWVEDTNFGQIDLQYTPDFIFSDVGEFEAFPEENFFDGCVVYIADCSGLGASNNILGLVSNIISPAEVFIMKSEDISGWIPLLFTIQNTTDFDQTAEFLPSKTKVVILNASGLSPTGTNYQISNLAITVSDEYQVLIMKDDQSGNWHISPPSYLRYIGDTRLFSSSLDYSHPTEGEMSWDFTEPDFTQRAASVFYYNGWVYNVMSEEWEMTGVWENVDTNTYVAEPPQIVNFDVILVYCDGNLLTDGQFFVTSDYQFKYTINPVTGEFDFEYYPRSYKGSISFPQITISDSLTTSFVEDITKSVFSGPRYHISPNVGDSETLLRLWKSQPLFCINDNKDSTLLSYPNALVADLNSGPSDNNWERYFVRLPPAYQRNGSEWQKVNLICQDFGYWGSPSLPEEMGCPSKDYRLGIYENSYLQGNTETPEVCLYSEPYWFSTVIKEYGDEDNYGNGCILPTTDLPFDGFDEGDIKQYDPFHERRANVSSPVGKGYGDWEGDYFEINNCSNTTGHLINDIESESLGPLQPPVWDMSMYKMPQTCVFDDESGKVDANHFKIGYAFFAADMSAAEEGFFAIG